mgnify:CR=1 FL=1
MAHPVFEANDAQRNAHPFVALSLGEAGEQEGQLYVLEGGEHGQQVELLKDETDMTRAPGRELRRGHGTHLSPAYPHRALGWLVQSGDEIQECGLAGP